MKRIKLFVFCMLSVLMTMAGKVEKSYTFQSVSLHQRDRYHSILIPNTLQAGITGEPSLPYQSVALLLPPGEKAISIEIKGEQLTEIPGDLDLYPFQYSSPLSKGHDGKFVKKEQVYRQQAAYPSSLAGKLSTQYLHGHAFALATFTPVVYHPAMKKAAYYRQVTVVIHTSPAPEASAALRNLNHSGSALLKISRLVQNPEMIDSYPQEKSTSENYKILIITPFSFETGYQPLRDFYAGRGITSKLTSVEYISQGTTGTDLQDKIRNYIISEYQNSGIEHVILGGDVAHIPHRGFYCYVISGSGYEDNNIPADLYYAGLDGNWNTNGDWKWAEPGEDDLLPEISVGRMSFSNSEELENMVHKSVNYQENTQNWEMNKPYMVSEYLYDPPITYGSDYLELLIDDHSDNGYFTYGIPSADNDITRLYDAPGFNWSTGQVIAGINAGKGFIHHCGHSNADYMMRLNMWDVNNQNFSQVNGINQNYQLMYTHGCICGAFDEEDCIAEKATTIDNWLAAGVFNSRYGWFNQGQTEGPSAHLHREFISAVYNPDPDEAIAEIGAAHSMSKIMTAPWTNLPGEFEPGAQRWCMYDCNVLGDPALKVWRNNPSVGLGSLSDTRLVSLTPNPCSDFCNITLQSGFKGQFSVSLINTIGVEVLNRQLENVSNSATIHLSVSGLPSGSYICRISSPTTTETAKLIISR
jgi:hypothetical protein